jgi:hypothetical protein
MDCIFYENSAHDWGGGIYNDFESCPTFINCAFMKNSTDETYGKGGGMYTGWYSRPIVANCTFFKNKSAKGGGILNREYAHPFLTNCILWEDTAGHPPVPDEICNDDSTASCTVTYCDVQEGWPGTGNIDSDPLFVDGLNLDIHLTYQSPCRDAGDNHVVTELYDFEGDPRITYGTVDMGADEFYTHLYCTGYFTPGGRISGKLVGLPGTSPVGLFFGSGVLDPPMPTAWGNFHLQAPWFVFPLVPIPANGVLVLPATIPATPPAPYDLPMQALIGLNPDSLMNLFVLGVR